MILRRSIKRFAALAAAFALTLQALWPLLAHARPNEPSLLVPLCTVEGTTHYLEINTGTTTPFEHCKLCVVGDEKAVVSIPDLSAFLVAENPEQRISALVTAFRKPSQLLQAQPRAPPQAS